MVFTPRPVVPRFILVGCVSILSAAAIAQDVPVDFSFILGVPSVPAQVVDPAAAPSAKPVAEAAKSPEEKLLAELLKVKFDRSPASILQAQAKLAEGALPADNKPEQFRINVVAGRWPEAGAFLKSLPEKDALKVYEYLLRELERVAPVTPGQPQPQVAGPTLSPTLLQEDIAALADISPAPLADEQIKLLGVLLTRVLSAGSFLDPLLQRFESGTEQLGGKDPRKRELVAQLLLTANRPADALRFLTPLEVGRETSSLPLLDQHVRCIFSLGRLEQKPESVQHAWELNQLILSAADCPADLREKAWRRCGDIVRFLPAKGPKAAWTKSALIKDPKQTLNLLVAIGHQVAADRSSRDIAVRLKNLEMQRQMVDALLPDADQRALWQPALNLFAAHWIEEADYARRLYQSPRNQMVQYDEFGNRIFMGNQPYQQIQNSNQLPPVALVDLVANPPSDIWLGAVDPALTLRALTVLAESHLKLEQDTKALPFLEQLAARQPKEGQRIANELLRVWAATHDPRRGVPQRQSQVIYYSSGMTQQQQGIPITRALQERNLAELSALLARLRKMPIPPLDDSAIVAAFTTAHSQAEVFREESIELVLGKFDEVRLETLAELLQTMRLRLATQWRKPSVQQQAKTQRTDVQIDAEILRGYELLAGLIQKGLQRQADDWRLNLTKAATMFDWAEFQYGKKVDLAIYVEKRDLAFDAFKRAADLYASKLPSLEEKDETPLIYQQWLNANLGASDLALVTRQQEPSASQIQRIRAAIDALPGAAAERHLNALAKSIGSNESLPAHLKPSYMRAALAVVGDRPDSVEIRKLVDYYDGLLREIELCVRVDGDTTVGHQQPFGVFLTVRHSAEIERENAGGFGKYLRNQTQNPYYSNPFGTAPIDHRDELEKQMREKLGEGFEILSLTFHDEKVQSRGYGRAGWRETPLVYLLLKARDASVDRLPSVRLNADFVDARGPVVLPVESPVQLIDARPASVPARLATELEATLVLDDRTLKDGKLTLEIKATGKGLIPAFADLFQFTPTGFKIESMDDSGPAIQRLASDGDALAPAGERNWLIKMTAEPSAESTARFQFPQPTASPLKVTFKRYQDVDLVEVAPDLALAGLPLRSTPIWRWAALGAFGVTLAGFVVARFKRRPEAATVATYTLPATITPFTTLQLLRQIHGDQRLALSSDQRGQIATTVAEIEAHYFARKANGVAAPDLESIGRTWVDRTRELVGSKHT